jgi:CubicO group peptidase (beta-lactamase class C family)
MSKLILYVFFFLAGFLSKAQAPNAVKLIDSTMELYARENFSGVVLVAKGKQVLFEKAYGEADKEKHVSNTTATRFNIASMGKSFTATMIMKLVEEGKINVNDPIDNYLPQYKIPNGNLITTHYLLTHTSGLSNYMLHPDFSVKKDQYVTLDSVMRLVADMPLTFTKPGESWRYSNSGFIVLGKLLEKITGKSYDENLKNLFKSIGMGKPLFPRKYEAPNTALPYYLVSTKKFTNEIPFESGTPYSDGGVQCSASDIYKFALAVCENKILSKDTRAIMLKPYNKAGRGTYSYGWTGSVDDKGRIFSGHSGGSLTFSSELRMNVDDQYIVVVLSNVPTNTNRIINGIMETLYTGTNGWFPKKPLANLMFEIVDEKGVAYLKENLDTIMKKGGYPVFRNAGPLIPTSEMLTKFKMYEEALQVLQFAASKFPEDAAPHNGMGDTYKAMGDQIKAIESFKKASLLDPKDEYSISQLRQFQK